MSFGISFQAWRLISPLQRISWGILTYFSRPPALIASALVLEPLNEPLNALAYPALDINNPFAPINTVVHEKDDKNNIAPRLGFAFVPHSGIFADGKTVFFALREAGRPELHASDRVPQSLRSTEAQDHRVRSECPHHPEPLARQGGSRTHQAVNSASRQCK